MMGGAGPALVTRAPGTITAFTEQAVSEAARRLV